MTVLDLIIIGVLVYFIYTRFTSADLPKKKGTNKAKEIIPGIKIKTLSSKNATDRAELENIIKKAREFSEETEKKEEERKNLEGIEKVKAYDSRFNEKEFLKGAKKAYTWFYDCLNKDNETALQQLLSPRIYSKVIEHLDTLDTNKKTETTEISNLEGPILLECRTVAKTAFIDVKYKAELTITTTDEQNKEQVDKKTENKEVIWTWARNITSTDPNWQLDAISNVS